LPGSPHDITPLFDEPFLLEQLADGSESAFTAIYRHYSSRVYNTAMMYLQDVEEAKEIVQTVFIRLWEKREKLQEVINFKDYLFIVSRNLIFQHFREKARLAKNADKLSTIAFLPTEDTDYKVRESQYKDLLQKGIDNLAPQQRKVYVLSRQQEKSIDEIAAELNISRNTARNHLTVALRYMRAYINENTHPFVALPLVMLLWQ
jgi:RNA polymerase sigma-70 factor (family 1)